MKRRELIRIVPLSFCFAFLLCHVGANANDTKKKSRTFDFEYGATIAQLAPGAKVRVWIPIPSDSSGQNVELQSLTIPGATQMSRDRNYGNRMIYFEAIADVNGNVEFNNVYRIKRLEMSSPKILEFDKKNRLDDEQRKKFLTSNSKVPIDGRPLELIDGIEFKNDALLAGQGDRQDAQLLYKRVLNYLEYDKSKPGYGNGDVIWACDSRTGNCTDFHSVFISLARSREIPSKFEIGFPLPGERGKGRVAGYHCWAQFFADGYGWIPVDISEADKNPKMKDYFFGNLTENRVSFSTGRDIVLQPEQDGPPLNYFVYPYVEVEGKPWPMEKIEARFGYEDIQ
ncbi:transglutaminase domain-containing protein [Vicingaceae bacterium]|nr:transglutaminase domain-containing protein [Vicingaceae bacterium]